MKDNIPYTAIKHLQDNSDIKAEWITGGVYDGDIQLHINGIIYKFQAIIKKELRPYQLADFWQKQKETPNLLIIAENIFPKIKDELKKHKLSYIETNGNMYINAKALYYYIDTNKKQANAPKNSGGAFTKAGLKVVFQLLLNKELLNKPQRQIAERASVALGNIHKLISDLKQRQYLLPLNTKEYIWENRKGLLAEWIEKYEHVLRPKLLMGHYTLKGNWADIKLKPHLSCWGGEAAADILTQYLRPEKLVLYTKESPLELMKNYHLIPHEDGEIEVLTMFWDQIDAYNTVPAILIYADLLIEGGKRNNETAIKIFHEYIESKL